MVETINIRAKTNADNFLSSFYRIISYYLLSILFVFLTIVSKVFNRNF